MSGIFPALERALDLINKGPLTLLTGYQTPAAIRRPGTKRLQTSLRNRKVLRADQLAEAAVEAAERQHTSLPEEKLTTQMMHTLPKEVMLLNEQAAELDNLIEARLRDHQHFDVITSMPGMGAILSAEFLAAFGGAAPAPRDSGKISGNLRRPQRYNRQLQHVLHTSAPFSIRRSEESRRFYNRKRAEGKHHTQALLTLARRRVNAPWALIQDGWCNELTPPTAFAA